MGSFFRSEEMGLYNLVMHPDYAFDYLVELGNIGCVQLLNVYDGVVTPNMKYNNEVERCEEAMRIIHLLQEEIDSSGLYSYYYADVDKEEIPREEDLTIIEKTMNALLREFFDISKNCEGLRTRKFSLLEHREVILQTQDFLTGSRNTEVQITSYDAMIPELLQPHSRIEPKPNFYTIMRPTQRRERLTFIVGSLPMDRFSAFELMVFRVSRGNAHIKHNQYELSADLAREHNESRYKIAFLIVFMGKELEMKLLKVAQGFHAKVYACPETFAERKKLLQLITNDLNDLEGIFKRSCEYRRRVLLAATPEVYIWRSKLRKIHKVYVVMNRLGNVRELRDMHEKYLQADCWIPRHSFRRVRRVLYRNLERSDGKKSMHTFLPILQERKFDSRIIPPTLFRTNKFTAGFQNLIDAYGMATYRELNPCPYTIVTFPFLFAIMFGDTGHGLLLSLSAWLLIYREDSIKRAQKESIKFNEIFDIIFAGRYILLLMGIFSIYTGFIYNDHFAKTLNVFGSSWRVNFTVREVEENKFLELDPAREDNYIGIPYMVGIDPIWNAVSQNAIIVSNSLKMKLSVILGVCQMIFGLTLSAANAIESKKHIDLIFIFLPQLIFFVSIFFYLVFLIFFKWYSFGGHLILKQSSGCAPSILITFINMILLRPPEVATEGCNDYMYLSQPTVQRALLFIAIMAVPVLLCGKPMHFMWQQKIKDKILHFERKKARANRRTLENLRKLSTYTVDDLPGYYYHEIDQKISDVWIKSSIHTIECVLGSVSHTASYLRLWALSLAHAQLADVLWKMVLQTGLKANYGFFNSIIIFITFGVFACLTFFILVVMEGLSAFLHTLRLHWVEFESKFFKGDGHVFTPFQFEPSTKHDAQTQYTRDVKL